jgi:hypothetical protein
MKVDEVSRVLKIHGVDVELTLDAFKEVFRRRSVDGVAFASAAPAILLRHPHPEKGLCT